jgi:hypothetical protein
VRSLNSPKGNRASTTTHLRVAIPTGRSKSEADRHVR